MITRRALGVFGGGMLAGAVGVKAAAKARTVLTPKPPGSTVEPAILDRIEMLQAYPPQGETALVGDSLIRRLKPMTFLREGYANYGVGGSDARHLMSLVPTIRANAKRAVVLVGINALARKRKPAEVAGDVRHLAAQLAMPVLILAPLPIREGTDGVSNKTIKEMAGLMKDLPLVPTPALEVDGQLASQYTRDGVHLTVAGYEALMVDLKPALASDRWAIVT